MRTIFHLDLDAFFCAVEELRDPTLRGKPFAVGGKPNERGVVASASYPARAFGVRSAMPTAQALRLCPKLVLVPNHMAAYAEYSQKVMGLLREYTAQLQQMSVDEAFLDLTGFSEQPRELALEIQKRIADELQLPASIGVASSKLVAKMASGTAKPNGVFVVEAGGEAAYLAPMPVGELWGIGKMTVPRLEALGIRTIGQLQHANANNLRRVFGNQTDKVIERARGIDPSPVETEREAKSISEERTFNKDISDGEALRKVLLTLSDDVAASLRKHQLFARTVHLKLRWQNFTTITRQTTLAQPTQLGEPVFNAVEKLWRATWRQGQAVRLLGVGVSGLGESAGAQLALFDDAAPDPKLDGKLQLAKTLDQLKAQYGDDVVKRASLKK